MIASYFVLFHSLELSGNLTVGSQIIGNTTTVDSAADPNVNGIDIVFYTASLGGGTIYLNSAMNQVGYKVKLIRTSTTAAADLSGSGGALVNGAAAKALPTAVYSTTTCVMMVLIGIVVMVVYYNYE